MNRSLSVSGNQVVYSIISLLILYIVLPLFLYWILYFPQFPHNIFVLDANFIYLSIAVACVLIVAAITLMKGKQINLNFDDNEIRWVRVIGTLGSIATTIPLLFHLSAGLPDNRNDAFTLFETYRGNVLAMAANNLLMIAAIIDWKFGNKKTMAVYLIVCVLPEILLGTRINLIRIVISYIVFSDISVKNVCLIGAALLSGALCRTLLYQYEYYDGSSQSVVMTLGELMNTMLGANIVFQSSDHNLVNVVPSIVRVVIPPMFRSIDESLVDLTTAVNQKYFLGMGLYGLAGSPITDFIVAPIVSTFLVGFGIFMGVANSKVKEWNIKSNFKSILVVFALSILIYIPRWGVISTVTFALSFVIWYIFPLMLLHHFMNVLRNRNKAPGLQSP